MSEIKEIKRRVDLCELLKGNIQQFLSLDIKQQQKQSQQDLDILNDEFIEFENNINAIKVEIRASSPEEICLKDREYYKNIIKDYKKFLDNAQNEFIYRQKNIQHTKERIELFDDNDNNNKNNRILQISIGEKINSETGIIDHGDNILNASKESLQNTLANVAKTREVGIHITTNLEVQTQQINRINQDVYDIENTIERAGVITQRMLRKIFTDKYVCCFTILVALLIIFILIWKFGF
jgi:hypothetical protein